MFLNFEKAFLKKNEINESIPVEIVKSLSEKLPEGFEYKGLGHGACGIMPTSPQLNLGLMIEVPDDLLNEFKPSTMRELLEFIYRTQRELKVIPDKEGYITLNGLKFKLEDMIKFPLEDEIMAETEWYISPPPFQPPFEVPLEGRDTIRYISIKRQPYADMYKSCFKNVDNDVFEICYILDEKGNKINFKFNINIEKSKNVTKIIEGLKLYQSFLKGEIKFAGIDLSNFVDDGVEFKVLEKTIEFWDRIYKLEIKLNIEFILEFPVTIDNAIWVEELYRSFVEEKPYKQYVNIDKITIEGTEQINQEELTSKEGLMIQFVQNSELEIWGVKLNMYDCVGLFDVRVIDIVPLTNNDLVETELLLEPTTDKGIYQSIRHFTNKEEADSYRGSVKDLENAELIILD